MMKKSYFALVLVVLATLLLTACSNNDGEEAAADPGMTTVEMADKLAKQGEQPPLVDLTENEIQNLYHLDPALLEEFTIRVPLMNVKTNEIAVVKVKDEKDVQTVMDAIKQRAADVQKSFETYLPDQYENAKNYKLVAKGQYVGFFIADDSQQPQDTFESFFAKK
ncbi:DUF4358 domain-containing protein [Paenibacillus methanolicus]|uniref:Uncharacterized protein DUF4358 n=1 Tax=Paenibacillus methanolicus TaxID=582686 RepID=A0A5S5BQY9_9BACL|nr:DUF4358 domain-containing protein [Paenibacillus methanolicus]TYP69407.1 uncharacterized protein DUF4358 [Paenibacillus methanolicus]